MTIRIWPILLVGFGALVVLIGLSGWLASARARSTYDGISELYQAEHRTQESLTQIRSDIDKSAILLRDVLLDPRLPARGAQADLEQLRSSTEKELQRLDTLVPKSQFEQLLTLRRQIAEYWASLTPAFAETGERSQVGLSLLQNKIAPHRKAALGVVAEVRRLSFEAFDARKKEIDARNAGLAVYLARVVGVTLLIALAVAGVSGWQMQSLERTAEMRHRQVQEAETRLRKLSQQLVQAQEEERRSLSRELHDQLGQVLTALRMSLGNLEKTLGPEGNSTEQELRLAKRLVGQALRSTRDLAMGLRPTMLDDLGLEAALEWYARQHGKLYGVPVTVRVQTPINTLSDAQKTCVYRIVQEALNNAAKYAQATQVSVALLAEGEQVTLAIHDDGRGFDMSGGAGQGLGLLGMRERIAQLGGSISIDSSPQHGTWIRAHLPVQVHA